MFRFVVAVLTIIGVLALGRWLFGIDPSTSEVVLIVLAWIAADIVEVVAFGER